MDFLEHAVRTAEEYTKVPFPTRFVAYLFADAVGDAGGRHFGTNIISKPYADGGDDSDAGHIAHEVGHYYWGGDRPWLNEAGAAFIEYFSELERTGRPVESRGTQCLFFKTIKAMELAGVRFDSHESRCIYALGQQFMLDMYYGLGDAAFRQGLHNFLTGNVKGISGLTQSFKQPLSPEKAFFVDLAVAGWFGTTPLIGPGFLESSPPDPLLTAINGRIEDLKLNLRQRDENYRLSSDDEREAVQLTVEFSHHVNGLFELPLKVAHVAENGSVLTVQELTIDSYDRGVEEIEIPLTKEPGQYWVVLVEGNRKVAEVFYVITP